MGEFRTRERPVAWGTTGLPWEPAWVWDIEALGCVGRGFDERPGEPPADYLSNSATGAVRHQISKRILGSKVLKNVFDEADLSKRIRRLSLAKVHI
jgi:hypothetical protein